MLAAVGLLMAPLASASGVSTLCSGPGDVYCSGNINGTINAWTLNLSKNAVSDSFVVGDVTATSVDFGAWLTPGDSLTAIDWCISTDILCAKGGNSTIASGTGAAVSLGPSEDCNGGSCDLGNNSFRPSSYDVQSLQFSLGLTGIKLSGGTYYLTLQNAVVTNSDPGYWDENDGLSVAQDTTDGVIPSEAFAIVGTATVPEPGSVLLFGTGALFLTAAFRRKLRKS